jgi:tRNA-Thr(GGU) m(6)t(6)A37 methyltransferase TsaA
MSEIKVIGHLHTDLPEKFGLPRQSGLAESLTGRIVMEPEYRDMRAFEGIMEYSRLWLLWRFDVPEDKTFRAQVRPPRLGGNEYRGVFATRSPFRPNAIGMTCVKLVSLEDDPELGPVLTVAGIDMMDSTAIYDIKPYLAYADAYPDAGNGFADPGKHLLEVYGAGDTQDGASEDMATGVVASVSVDAASSLASILAPIPEEKRAALLEILRQDPRPSYQEDPTRIYGMSYAGFQVKFRVEAGKLYVIAIEAG